MAVEDTTSPWVAPPAPSGFPANAVPSWRTRRAVLGMAALHRLPRLHDSDDDAVVRERVQQLVRNLDRYVLDDRINYERTLVDLPVHQSLAERLREPVR